MAWLLVFGVPGVSAHGVNGATRVFLSRNDGVSFIPFLYISAKPMNTGYDHRLWLAGVIFFLNRPKEILPCVSLFTLGHSTPLLPGVNDDVHFNAYLIDATIALPVV